MRRIRNGSWRTPGVHVVNDIVLDGVRMPKMRTPKLRDTVLEGAAPEVSGMGCAIAAFVGFGVFKSYKEAVAAMVRRKEVFTPDMEQHKIYERLYEEVYKKIYGRLAGLYEKLYEIYHGVPEDQGKTLQ